jgi:hypothetical protein
MMVGGLATIGVVATVMCGVAFHIIVAWNCNMMGRYSLNAILVDRIAS